MSNLLKSKFLLGVMVVTVMFAGLAFVLDTQTAAAADCTITKTLRVGSKGAEVQCLQAAVGVVADGSFGPKTAAAVKAWQASKGLVADGIFGAKSRAAFTGSVSTTYPAGCTSSVGFSPLTGVSCATGVLTTLPSGCTSTSGYSSTTGASCSGAVVVPTTGAVSVALASSQPTGSLITDSNTVNMAVQPVLALNFSNGTGSAVNVNTLKLTRTGFAVDGDVSNLYLYDGATKLAEMNSVTSKVFTFSNSSGLFTIPANTSKVITVKVMVVNSSSASYLGFSVVSASDVVATGAVGGTFPIAGPELKVASVTDLGYVNLTAYTTYPTTISPSTTAQELWRFTATANGQKMNVNKIVMTMVGTITNTDIQDLALTVGGVQVGATAQIGTDNKLTFDLSATPYQITSGQSKVFVLMGKVVKGTSRAFKFTLRSNADFSATDNNYGVDTPPLKDGAAFAVIEPTTGSGTSISNGTLTISRSANSPTGNVSAGALDVPLARFDYKAVGEDIKVSYVKVITNEEDSNHHLDNGKLYYNGSQVGTTDVVVTDGATVTYTLGNAVVIPAGTTGVFEFRADMTQGAGTALALNQTILVSLASGTTDATGQTSLANIATAAATGQTLTVKTGTLSVVKNTSVADATTVNSTGVLGATNVKVASMVVTAGSGEGATLTQIVVGDDDNDATSDFGANFQNLTLRNGALSSTSTPLATVQGTLVTTQGQDYTFNLSPSITVAAGAQYVIDVYADILTGAPNYAAAEVGLEFVSVSATGVNTSTDLTYTNSSTPVDLQKLVISSYGTLTVSANASTPVAGQLVMGETAQTLAILDFTAGSAEDVNVSVVTITDTSTFGGSLSNIKLYAQGVTEPIGTMASFSIQTNGVATFNLASDWVIPKNTVKTLTIKADVNAYGSAVSGGSHTLNLASNANVTSRGAQSGTAIAETVTSATGTAQTVYRTKVLVSKGSSSPSGSSVAGANATVLEFDVAANAAYDAVVNAVAITMSGSVDTTSTGDAKLYKSTDLVNALSTEAYKQDLVSVSGNAGAGTVTGSAGDWDGIPVGATVMINDTSVSATAVSKVKVTAVSSTVLTYLPLIGAASDNGIDVGVTYRPMQPGTGKVFFGAQTTLTADLADGGTTVTVASTDGFAVGDTVKVAGFTTAGLAVTWESGCVVASVDSATQMTTSACQFVDNNGIDFNYVSELAAGGYANAITNSQNSSAVVYTGLIGEVVSAGTTKTFVVKGDTTGATSTETLRADIAAVGDLNWDDKVNWGITTITKNLPVIGGTLTY